MHDSDTSTNHSLDMSSKAFANRRLSASHIDIWPHSVTCEQQSDHILMSGITSSQHNTEVTENFNSSYMRLLPNYYLTCGNPDRKGHMFFLRNKK
jgi:hypothetical protein